MNLKRLMADSLMIGRENQVQTRRLQLRCRPVPVLPCADSYVKLDVVNELTLDGDVTTLLLQRALLVENPRVDVLPVPPIANCASDRP